MKQELYISPKSIIWFFASLIILFLLWYIKEILFLVFVVLLLFAAFNPILKFLQKIHIPRFIGVFIIYVIFLSLLALILYLLIPPTVYQLQLLSTSLPLYIEKFKNILTQPHSNFVNINIQNSLNAIAQSLSKFSEGIWSGIVSIFGGIISFLVIVVASIYLLLSKEDFYERIKNLVPKKYQEVVNKIIQKSLEKLGYWTLGQIVLCIVIGIAYFIVLSIFRVKFALVLAIVGGALEIVPTIGPIISGIAALAFAFIDSPLKALAIIIAFALIQQFENHFLVPIVMKKAINLNPVFTIFALLIGAKLGGIIGAIIAVPLLAVLFVIWEEAIKTYENSSNQ